VTLATNYTRFVHSDQWFARIIQWRTKSKWFHVEHVLSDGSVVRAFFPGGVQHLPVGQVTASSAELRCQFPLTTAQIAAGEAFLLAQVGTKYDWFALIGLAFGRNWASKTRWICAKLEDGYYKAIGIELLGTVADVYATPANLAEYPPWTVRETMP